MTTKNGANGSAAFRSLMASITFVRSGTASAIGALLRSHHVRVLFRRAQALLLLELDVQAEPADLVAQHVEAHRRAGLQRVGALDHRLVDLGPALDVVRLDRQ